MRKLTSRTFSQVAGTGLPVQVAAVCYRIQKASLEFLLINTSSGRWTFPKGHIAAGLTGSESAAREALEEAGVSGRIEEAHFASYLDSKRIFPGNGGIQEILVAAYLMEVGRIGVPEEDDRNPTWFTSADAKDRLMEKRLPRYAIQLSKTVEAAVEQILARQLRLCLREPESVRRGPSYPDLTLADDSV